MGLVRPRTAEGGWKPAIRVVFGRWSVAGAVKKPVNHPTKGQTGA